MDNLLACRCLDSSGRQVFFLSLSTFEAFPIDLRLPCSHFVCLLASDPQGSDDIVIKTLGSWLLGQGMVYVNVWGPDCERVHDLIDEVIIAEEWEGIGGDEAILTAWWTGDALAQVLDDHLNTTVPAKAYQDTCSCSLLISVGHPEWDEQIQQILANFSHAS